MDEIVRNFPAQVEEALELALDINFNAVSNVVITAMGGSAISADILRLFSKVPFTIVRD